MKMSWVRRKRKNWSIRKRERCPTDGIQTKGAIELMIKWHRDLYLKSWFECLLLDQSTQGNSIWLALSAYRRYMFTYSRTNRLQGPLVAAPTRCEAQKQEQKATCLWLVDCWSVSEDAVSPQSVFLWEPMSIIEQWNCGTQTNSINGPLFPVRPTMEQETTVLSQTIKEWQIVSPKVVHPNFSQIRVSLVICFRVKDTPGALVVSPGRRPRMPRPPRGSRRRWMMIQMVRNSCGETQRAMWLWDIVAMWKWWKLLLVSRSSGVQQWWLMVQVFQKLTCLTSSLKLTNYFWHSNFLRPFAKPEATRLHGAGQ